MLNCFAGSGCNFLGRYCKTFIFWECSWKEETKTFPLCLWKMNKNLWVCNENEFRLLYRVHQTMQRSNKDLSLHEQWGMSSAAYWPEWGNHGVRTCPAVCTHVSVFIRLTNRPEGIKPELPGRRLLETPQGQAGATPEAALLITGWLQFPEILTQELSSALHTPRGNYKKKKKKQQEKYWNIRCIHVTRPSIDLT